MSAEHTHRSARSGSIGSGYRATALATSLVVIGFFTQPAQAQLLEPGSLLKQRMSLQYEAGTKRGEPWMIDLVEMDRPHAGREHTSHIRIRKDGRSSAPEDLRLARDESQLLEFAASSSHWQPSRPLRPGQTLKVRDSKGPVTSRYETGAYSLEQISGIIVTVLLITVTFLDAAGKPSRRLRERYSIGLATATGGVFETAEDSSPGQFKPTLKFELIEIKLPRARQ